ncbi:MAG: hypothetical protein HQL31_02710 [Planctomycetes bacterium]|nr:hypothetical protein [Planctomycetota bacterium]
MENTSNESIAAALKLLEEAAMQKKDELKTVMSDKFTHLRELFAEGERSAAETLTSAKDRAIAVATHARDISAEKAHEVAQCVGKSVHQNPWPYIAGTAVTGILLGHFLGRDRK